MKKIKITILETIGDGNNWMWYDIFRNSVRTPKEAVEFYLREEAGMGGEDLVMVEEGGFVYSKDYDVRAINYTI